MSSLTDLDEGSHRAPLGTPAVKLRLLIRAQAHAEEAGTLVSSENLRCAAVPGVGFPECCRIMGRCRLIPPESGLIVQC